MTRYKMAVSYDGTDYAGWQVQPNGVTIQEKLEKAVKEITGETVKIHGSGRTDQGVHAREQVCHFDLQSFGGPLNSLKKGLNAILPADIRVLKIQVTHPSFHARRTAKWKEYRYFIWNGAILPPFLCRYRTHIRHRLDVGLMNRAAAALVGRHDFAAFTANPNREIESTVRRLMSLKVVKRGNEITLITRSDGYLYRMVRSLAGFLIRVGEGAVPWEKAGEILKSRERTARVPTARAQGLFLWKVGY